MVTKKRRTRRLVTAREAFELGPAAQQVIAHRTARMALGWRHADAISRAGLGPIHRKAVANAKRLSRRR